MRPALPIRAGRAAALALLALFLAAPIVVVAGVSLNRSGLMAFPPRHLSLRWYAAFFADDSWTQSLLMSLVIAAAAAVLAASIALPIAYTAWRRGSVLARLLAGLGALPFMLPSVVLAIVFMLFWSSLGHLGRIEDTIVSHAVVFVAMPLATIGLGFRGIDLAAIEAAQTMGADEGVVARTIILPLIQPYVLSGMMFVFIASLNEYLIAYMAAGFEVETLPIKVFNNLRMGFQPTMCVGAVLFMLVGVAGFSAVAFFSDLPKLLGGRAAD